ncbi:TetR-like C-terminal domain-containing protein [Nocardia sp. CA-107356]|uniref:TetR-like C-terminal domain-containing protein n=1 Tax=Nocardia sp. CA-107356 TaxID=3239972 RepID=UPI003D8C782C
MSATSDAMAAVFDVLTDAIAECVCQPIRPTLAIMWWSSAHGTALLWLDGQLENAAAKSAPPRRRWSRTPSAHLPQWPRRAGDIEQLVGP